MEPQIPVLEDENNLDLTDLALSQFRGLAKEYFSVDLLQRTDSSKLLDTSRIFYSFTLPEEITEEFILLENAPFFWSYKSPLITHIENFIKNTYPQTDGQSFYKRIKEFYVKWLTISSEEEKKYFAISVISSIENKSNKNNFLHLIYHSMVLGYDNSLFNPEKSLELLEKSGELINNIELENDIKTELTYLVNIYKGLLYLKQNRFEEAGNSFSEANTTKSDGINFKFYNTYLDCLKSRESFPSSIMTEILNYDFTRIEFAIENNDPRMLDYFINYPTITNIFNFPELAYSFQAVSDFLYALRGTKGNNLAETKEKLNNFKNLNMVEYYDEKIVKDIEFVELFIRKYSDHKNVLFTEACNKLHQKLSNTLQQIFQTIRNKYENEITDKLSLYDKQIRDKNFELEQIAREYNEFKERLKKKLETTLSNIEKNAKVNIDAIEEKIENLHLHNSLNPFYAFKNAMTYNIILSSTIFFMGGCAGYSNNFAGSYNKLNDILFVAITTGLKWGFIAFSIGLAISAFYAGMTILKNSSQKQRLLNVINRIKAERDSNINYYKKEAKEREELNEETFNTSVENIKKYLETLSAEKLAEKEKYSEEAEKNIQEEAKMLLKLL